MNEWTGITFYLMDSAVVFPLFYERPEDKIRASDHKIGVHKI